MKKAILALLPALFLIGCNPAAPEDGRAGAETEIREAEAAFANMAQREGIPAAFLHFAADSAVIMRNNRLIKGKAAIADYLSQSAFDSVSLTWHPEKVVAAASGDLGYTYGPYRFFAIDTAGQEFRSEGVFHTVWQKQTDGNLRYLWD